jgi:biotin carboxyl carrier protein
VSVTYRFGVDRVAVRLEQRAGGGINAVIQDGHGERPYACQVQSLGDGAFLLNLDDQQTLIYTASANDSRFVWVNGETFAFTRETQKAMPGRGRRVIGAAGGQIEAPMPGQVRDVLVAVGDSVERGQTLLLLEAMKMELKITVPFDGTVSRLAVSQGDVVQRGQVLGEVMPVNGAE